MSVETPPVEQVLAEQMPVDDAKKVDKRKRTTARSKFTRTFNILHENIDDEDISVETMNSMFSDLDAAYTDLEQATANYLSHFDSDDEEFESSNHSLEDAYRKRCRIHVQISRKSVLVPKNENVRPLLLTPSPTAIHVKKLDPPKFSGNIREFPTFVKDYTKYMERIYGQDAYALRSCLTGKALDLVSGVDDDYDAMWKRLNAVFRNSEKLVDSILCEIKLLTPLKENDSEGLINLVNTIERCWLDLKKLNLEKEMNTSTMTSHVERLLPSIQKREWTIHKQREVDDDRKFEALLEFLLREKNAVEYMIEDIRGLTMKRKSAAVNLAEATDKISTVDNHVDANSIVTLQRAVEELTKTIAASNFSGTSSRRDNGSSSRCWLHDTDTHDIIECNSFKNLSDENKIETVKQNGACYRCLNTGHLSRVCSSRKKCTIVDNSNKPCNKAHHPILHQAHVSGISFHHTRNRSDVYSTQTLLMLSRVNCLSGSCNAILDPCSNLSLITHRAARKFNLKGKDVTVSITKVGNVTDVITTKEYILCIRDKCGKMWTIQVYGMDEITSNADEVDVSGIVNLFKDIRLEDVERPVGYIDLLLGLDCCELLPNMIAQVDNLQLMEGPLGYCLRGSHGLLRFSSKNINFVTINVHKTIVKLKNSEFFVNSETVKGQLNEFFNIESIGTSLLSSSCENCKQIFSDSMIENNDITIKEKRELDLIKKGLTYDPACKQWTVKYPWVKDASLLRYNFAATFGHLKSLERRLMKSPNVNAGLYCEQINDMLNRDVAKKLTNEEIASYKGPVYYIPHHGVCKVTSSSTPLRIVFNSSCPFMGSKINDYWAKGPDMLNSLMGVLLRFREERVAIHGDISKMFNSVRLGTLEQHTHRFLWRDMDTHRHPDQYCMLAVPFGDRPSGAITITAMHETAKMKKDEFPDAARVITRNTYVDDILKSVATLDEARRLIREIGDVLIAGGFKIKHWIISGVDSDTHMEHSDVSIAVVNEGNVLGMTWRPKEDVFKFKASTNSDVTESKHASFTRRTALSWTSKLYDPLGLLSPFTLRAKLIMREVCTITTNNNSDKGWDDSLPEHVNEKLHKFFVELPLIESLSFSRSIKPSTAVGDPILIIFSDGSQCSYGACAYIRWELADGSFISNLICAKNRLAPLKTLTIPRIELMGAVIACRLRATILREFDFTFQSIYHIIDSRIVLEQIHKDSYKFGVFVANRIAEVQNTTETSEWWWTESHNNAADIVTRPSKIDKLDSHWKHGPDYLSEEISCWPISQERGHIDNIPDIIAKTHVASSSAITVTPNLADIEIERYSDLDKLLRVTAIVLNIVKYKKFNCKALELSPDDLAYALCCWIKYVQIEFVGEWRNRFKRLGPTLRDDGIITVGNRISSWLKENWDKDHLVILPPKSQFSKLVVRSIHSINHDGVDTTIAKVRREYWIPHIYRLAKGIRRSCYRCRIQNKELCKQQMGQLPEERLKPSPPFYHTGVDLFGPILIRDAVKKRVEMKCYGVIFTCFTTRAIYLDITCGYDTENFLMVLRRFISVRGCPQEVRSDPGTQLIAAGKELKEYFSQIDQDMVNNFSTNNGIKWIVNKSADAPWQNGCTERLIRSVKRCITLTIGTSILTFPELQTVFFECSNIMNERPIGLKDGDHSYFCPNDLLLGRSSIKSPAGKFDSNLNPRKRFQFIENLTQMYWKRWQIHYFPSLILQQKWHVDSRNLCVGDVVLVRDTNSLRGQWKLAEVYTTEPSKDGKVRDVVLRYKNPSGNSDYTGSKDVYIKRSVHRLVVIVPVEERPT